MSSRKVNKGKPQEPEGEYRFPPPDESPARPASEEATNDGTIDSSSEDEANSLARELKDAGTKKQGKLVVNKPTSTLGPTAGLPLRAPSVSATSAPPPIAWLCADTSAPPESITPGP